MKTKSDRIIEMSDIITLMVNDNGICDIDIKGFILDMAHTFNLRKKDIEIDKDVEELLKCLKEKVNILSVDEEVYILGSKE